MCQQTCGFNTMCHAPIPSVSFYVFTISGHVLGEYLLEYSLPLHNRTRQGARDTKVNFRALSHVTKTTQGI